MTKTIDLIVFDPAGNTTLMVLTPVNKEDYADVAKKLLAIDFGPDCSWREVAFGEQVSYVVNGDTPRMDMCGLEFCGNASRSYAYYRVMFLGEGEGLGDGRKKIEVHVSGCDTPLTAVVDPAKRDSVIQMPLPTEVRMIDTAPAGIEGEYPFVIFDGISHLVVKGEEPDADKFARIKEYFYREIDPGMDAFGVMFINEEKDLMSPVVYVRDVDTTYFEGSCASGTAAASVAKSVEEPDGTYEFVFRQPDGTLNSAVTKRGGAFTEVKLGGIIETTEILHVEIPADD